MTIGERIRARREQLDMTQEELALRVGYKHKTSINKLEAGERKLMQDKILLFAAALEMTPEQLMGWDDETPAPPVAKLSDEEEEILTLYNRLNTAGQREARKRVKELTYVPMYAAHLMPVAAHALKPYDANDPEHASDDAIMNDDEEWK